MNRFHQKTVLITGGTNGIGLATAKRVQDEGATVIVTGTRDKTLQLARDVLGAKAHVIRNVAGEPAAAQALAAEVKKISPRLDAVFFNAGFGIFEPFEQVTLEHFESQFAVNVRGPFLQAQALREQLVDGGAIVINTSIVQNIGFATTTVYSATKGAVRVFARVLARELAPRGIRVNTVSPGPIATGFFERQGLDEKAADEFGAHMATQVPLGRLGKPEEVAAVAAFLLSGESSFVTGTEYVVDGGLSEL